MHVIDRRGDEDTRLEALGEAFVENDAMARASHIRGVLSGGMSSPTLAVGNGRRVAVHGPSRGGVSSVVVTSGVFRVTSGGTGSRGVLTMGFQTKLGVPSISGVRLGGVKPSGGGVVLLGV